MHKGANTEFISLVGVLLDFHSLYSFVCIRSLEFGMSTKHLACSFGELSSSLAQHTTWIDVVTQRLILSGCVKATLEGQDSPEPSSISGRSWAGAS